MKGWYQWNPRTPIGCSLKKNDVLLFQWKGSDWSGGWKWCWNQCPQNPQVSICLRAKRRGLGSRRRSNSSRSISTVSWKACLQRISISHHFKTPCTCSNNDMLVIFGDVWWCRICVALWGLRSSLQGLFAPEGTSRGTMRATIFPRTPQLSVGLCWTCWMATTLNRRSHTSSTKSISNISFYSRYMV